MSDTSPTQDPTIAEDLTMLLPEGREPPTIDQTN